MNYLNLLLASLFLSSCAYTAKTTNLRDLPNLPTTITGAAISVELDSEHSVRASDGCILSLLRIEDGRSFETEVSPGQELLVIELQPGTYEFHDAFCGRVTWNFLNSKFPRFLVQAGKLSFLQGLKIYVTGANNMSIKDSNRAGVRLEAQRFFGRLSQENRARIISGYTGKSIPPGEIEKREKSDTWIVADSSGKSLPKGDRQWPAFHACYRGEDDVNALWLGSFELEADYEGGDLVASKVKDSWHSFSDQFVRCANSVISEFHPKSKAKLFYTIYL